RVSVLTINSLAAISKVRSSSNPSNPTNTLSHLRHFSTATERLELQNPNGRHQVDSSNQYYQNPGGFYDPTQNSGGQGLNPNRGFREGPRNDAGNYSVDKDVNFGRVHGKHSGDWQHNSNGSSQNYGGTNWESSKGGSQNNGVDKNESFSGYYGNNSGESHAPNPSGLPDSARGGYGGQQNGWSTYGSHQSWGQSQYSSNGQYSGNFGMYQQGPGTGKHQQENFAMHQQAPGPGQYRENLSVGVYQANVSPNQHSMNLDHVSGNDSMPVAEPAGSSENNRGTLEELDGFCKEGELKEAVEVLRLLEERRISVDLPRYLQLMQACGEYKALDEAKVVHEIIIRALSPVEVSTYNKILEMYSNCGAMEEAFSVFDTMQGHDLDSWNIMIMGLAKNERGEEAIDLFTQFKQAGLSPDAQMFIRVFYACSVLGDINEGMLHFESMTKDHHIFPSMEHYVSIVDMLGSNGYLDEALEFIEKMPMEPSIDVWETLMNLCRVHGNSELGARCAELVEHIDPSRLNNQSKAGLVPVKPEDLPKEKVKKKLGSQSILEARSRVHEYRAGDTSHPNNDKLYALLRGLREQMKEAGYIPQTRFVLHDIDQEGKEDALLAHSERLATAQGLLTSAARSPIRVIKNLRVCGDCHNAIKIISKIVGRELIMRDAKRFHHFSDGI
ncbi:hypothetical protein Tsubulata_037396, partial [Turnera subulata]